MNHPDLAFEPRDPAFRADPYPVYDELRRRDPVHYRAAHNDWVLTRYHDVLTTLKDARSGHVAPNVDAWTAPDSGASVAPGGNGFVRLRHEMPKILGLWFAFQNPPSHTRFRKLMQEAFSPINLDALLARAQAVTDAAIDRALPLGHMDIFGELGAPLPLAVICDILGVPEDERAALRGLAPELVYALDVDTPPLACERGWLALMRLTHYFRGLIARWRSVAPAQDNLIYTLMRAQAEGHLSEEQLLAQCSLMFFVGAVSSPHLITKGVLTLLRHPDQMQMLRAQPSLLETAIEEMLRYAPPGQIMVRVAMDDLEIGGKTIRRGQKMRLALGAANRDPAVFPDPDRFDITRCPNPHLTFGYGIHYCLGAMLARMMAKAAIGTLLRRLPHLRLQTDDLEWVDTFMVQGVKSLPVVFE